MAKAIVVYATRSGNTKAMAESIAAGLRETGIDATIIDADAATGESGIAGYDIYLFGSATQHGEMLHPMKKLLLIAERSNLQGKTGGAFGSYGWSGEAPEKIQEAMEYRCGMKMPENALRIKAPGSTEKLQQESRDFGQKIGRKADSPIQGADNP